MNLFHFVLSSWWEHRKKVKLLVCFCFLLFVRNVQLVCSHFHHWFVYDLLNILFFILTLNATLPREREREREMAWGLLVLLSIHKSKVMAGFGYKIRKVIKWVSLSLVELLGFALSLSKQLKKDVHMIKKVQDMRVSSFEDHMDLIIVSPSSFFSNRTCWYLPFFFSPPLLFYWNCV